MPSLGKIMGYQDDTDLKYSDEEKKIFVASYRIGWTVVACGVAGVVAIAFWAWTASKGPFTAVFGADLLVGAAASAVGSLFGFIFGIPRTLDPASRAAVATAASQNGTAASTAAVMAANTNLERISDWLTTLLIGATLVQIKDIVRWIGGLGDKLVSAGSIANEAVVPVIVIYFFTLAFLGVYLITRLYLTSAFVNTLGMLTGRSQRADDLNTLKARMKIGLTSGDSKALREALADYEKSDFARLQPSEPVLNDLLARALAALMLAGNLADRAGDAKSDIKKFVANAANDGALKEQLKKDMDSGTFKTNDAALDPVLLAAVS